MSNSDSDEFFDLDEQEVNNDTSSEQITPQNRTTTMDSTVYFSPDTTYDSLVEDQKQAKVEQTSSETQCTVAPKSTNVFKEPARPRSFMSDLENKTGTIEKRRKKLEELRRRMITDDEEAPNNGSPPGSHPSSVDGLFAANKPSHPFKFIDHDSVSLQSTVSLGRVGRVLGGEIKMASRSGSRENISRAPTPDSKVEVKLTIMADIPTGPSIVVSEPDVVASTKGSAQSEQLIEDQVTQKDNAPLEPVAPPRRKRKPKSASPQPPDVNESITTPIAQVAPTVEAVKKELEYSLDLMSATKGSYVTRPQDEESTRAERRNSSGETSKLGELAEKVCSDPNCSEEGVVRQLNMIVRTRTDSGKPLTDLEILEQVTVLNLDTGEQIPLSIAEDKLPKCINPLSLHIMRLTSEYVSNTSLEKDKESDNESVDSKKTQFDNASDGDTISLRKKTFQFKKLLGSTVRKTVDKAKLIAQEVSHARQKEEVIDIPDELTGGEQHVKMKASSSHKGPYEFDTLQCVQEMHGEHLGPVWCMKFSPCGRLLATAGQDRVLRIWVLKTAFNYFQDMRSRCNADNKASPTPSQESLVSQHSTEDPCLSGTENDSDPRAPFMERPFCMYSAHTSDLLDISWSKNYFILSSSMDKTVRLWHISRKECLCCFQHIDFVTAIAFHPRDDRYFLSGSLDGKLRLWNIPDKKVALWNELEGQTKLITAANFCQNGKFAVVGSYDGRCVFYTTEHLKYYTQIHVRSTRGKNSKGRKISGIETLPYNEDKILVTSNDSRIRLYDLRDLNLSCKYKGYVNVSSQIRASFSHDGKYIISGSENQYIYMWKTHHDYAKFTSARRDRNDYWEAIKAHNAVVTSAVFAPDSNFIIEHMEKHKKNSVDEKTTETNGRSSTKRTDVASSGYVLVSADFNGCIKVFVNKVKPKHSSLPVSALS